MESPAQLDSCLLPGFALNSQFILQTGGKHSSTQTRCCIIPDKLSLFSSIVRAHVSCPCLKHLCQAVSNTHPEHLPEEHGMRTETWESSGEKELVDPGLEPGKLSAPGWSRGEKRTYLKYKSIWDSQVFLLVKSLCCIEQQGCCLQCK